MTRDTQQFAHKYKLSKGRHPALRNLTAQEFGIQIQGEEHSSVRLIVCVERVCARVFTSVRRLQTPEPRWRYIVSIVASGKGGRLASYHVSETPIGRTPPGCRGNGNGRAEKGTTIHPAVGRKIQAPGFRRLPSGLTPQKRKIRHPWRRRKTPSGGQNWGLQKVQYEHHRVFASYSNAFILL